MADVEKDIAVSLHAYRLDLHSAEIESLLGVENAKASFNYIGGSLELIALHDIELDDCVALIDFSEGTGRINLFCLYDSDGALTEVMEIGAVDRPTKALRSRLEPMLMNRANPRAVIVEGYTTYENEKMVKLLLTDEYMKLF